VHGVLVSFYPAQAVTLDPIYATYLADHGLTGDPGLAVGEKVAAKIVTLRRLDPNPLPPPNLGEDAIGKWRPTQNHLGRRPCRLRRHLQTLAGRLPSLRSDRSSPVQASPPPELTSVRYTNAYNEVKAKGALTGSTRTPAQTDVANFCSTTLR
jgi:hypothetical protein